MTTTNETKQKSAIVATIEGPTLSLSFQNGRVLTILATDLTPEIRAHAMMHGLKQKLVDAAAISRNPENGRAASIEDKYNAVKTVLDRLTIEGAWNAVREGGGTGAGGMLAEALRRLYPGRDITAFLTSKTDAEKAALRKNARVAAVIEEIRAERAKPGDASGDDLLAELDDSPNGD